MRKNKTKTISLSQYSQQQQQQARNRDKKMASIKKQITERSQQKDIKNINVPRQRDKYFSFNHGSNNQNGSGKMPKKLINGNKSNIVSQKQEKSDSEIDSDPNQDMSRNQQLNFEQKIQKNLKIITENKQLRKNNKYLKKKLQQFEAKLTQTLQQKLQSSNSKQAKLKLGQQIVESMELRNAYKMCQIYKRQINYLKKRQKGNTQERVDQLENMVFFLQKEKDQLKTQIKDLKKVNKQMEKGWKQIGNGNGSKIIEQNQKLKQQVRRIQQLYNVKDNEKSNLITLKNKKSKTKLQEGEQSSQKQKKKAKKSVQKGEQAEKQKSGNKIPSQQQQQIEKLRNKIFKDHRKITVLSNQNSKLKQYVEELKNQIIEKDREFAQLRQKLAIIRQTKNRIQTLQNEKIAKKKNKQQNQVSFRNKRVQTQPQISSQKNKKNPRFQNSFPAKPSKSKKISHSRESSQQLSSVHETQQSPAFQKYPRIVESGYRCQQSIKFNHHAYLSKVLELRVYPHQDGHVGIVNFIYEKGEPLILAGEHLYENQYSKYASFKCKQSQGQFITYLKGGYKNGILKFLIVQNSSGKRANFCQFEQEPNCSSTFQFGTSIRTQSKNKRQAAQLTPRQYPVAFFGQTIKSGVCRLGCFLDIQKYRQKNDKIQNKRQGHHYRTEIEEYQQ